jgi:ATP-dependent helicase/nuclease subunit A
MSGAGDPDAAQRRAADPARSTWVSANAGSGKTRVLTSRVARLLLDGADPAGILCLTYTRAAAAEMQNRLFDLLGRWTLCGDAELRAELAALGAPAAIDDDRLAAARRLFARAIDTPGGLRIQTIHAFCAALLRRFPLEAGVSPGFAELDDAGVRRLLAAILDEMADGPQGAMLGTLLARKGEEGVVKLAESIVDARDRLAAPLARAAVFARFGLPPEETAEAVAARLLQPGDRVLIAAVAAQCAGGSSSDVKAAARLQDAAAAFPGPEAQVILEKLLLYGAGVKAPFAAKLGSFPTKATRRALGAQAVALDALMQRVEAARQARLAVEAAERSALLHDFAAALLDAYAARKAAGGWLDFADLIERVRRLLADPAVGAWVLWRLDGGIGHVLVDEAQDTSPSQWEVIGGLTAEITAGEGARGGRTLFVVGDPKQSIYSFQGADLAAFETVRRQLAARLAHAPGGLQEVELVQSFRSSPAILRLVDAVFDPARGQALDGARHVARHADMPGRVDLWPVAPAAPEAPEAPWYAPLDRPSPADPRQQLADRIAGWLGAALAGGERIATRDGVRPLQPGDVLILLRRRSALFPAVILALKRAGLPVAGRDRLKLGAELAVKDLTALLAFVALPEDDLALAAALRSPLLGWSEAELFALAHGRGGPLWAALRAARARRPDTLALLDDLRDRADFLRPYDLLARILARHDGRRRLLARLGPEAEDGIDLLLAQALAYEQAAVPDLTGFLDWLAAEEVEVRRQLDRPDGRIRVMTVHGAKGLEAPLVILPDSGPRWPPPPPPTLLRGRDGTMLWRVAAEDRPPLLADAAAAEAQATEAEMQRLLYVAMTRAESWLVVASPTAPDPGRPASDSWYGQVAAALAATGAQRLADGTLRLETGAWPPAAPVPPAAQAAAEPPPAWLGDPAPAPPRPPAAWVASDLGGARTLPGEGDPQPDPEPEPGPDARARGTALHRLLELLPAADRAAWPAIADRLGAADLLDSAARLLGDPALAPLFAPGTLAEVSFAAELGGRPITGTIDRLVVAADRVLAVDYKSNRLVPATAAEVPEGVLRQMGAYAHALAQVYPGRRIDTAILWTQTGRLMPLPPGMVREALGRATAP